MFYKILFLERVKVMNTTDRYNTIEQLEEAVNDRAGLSPLGVEGVHLVVCSENLLTGETEEDIHASLEELREDYQWLVKQGECLDFRWDEWCVAGTVLVKTELEDCPGRFMWMPHELYVTGVCVL